MSPINRPKFLAIGSTAHSVLNFRYHMLKELEDRGFEIHCTVSSRDSSETIEKIKQRGWHCHKLEISRKGLNPFADLSYLLQIRKLIRTLKPEKMFSYTIKPVIYTGLAMLLLGRPSARRSQGEPDPRACAMITGLGYAFMGQSLKQRVLNYFVRILYRLALPNYDLLVFQNSDDRELFQKLGLFSSRAKVIQVNGSGIALDEFPPAPLPRGPTLRFLMVARVLRAKGVAEYLDAAASITQQGVFKAEFLYLGPFDHGGDGFQKDEFLERCEAAGVKYLGETDDVRPFLVDSHILVLPSYREGLPRSVIEAMAVGRGIVTTDAPGCRETVVEGVNGSLVRVRDSLHLADAIKKLLAEHERDPHYVERLGESSRKIVSEKFDVRSVNQKIFENFLTKPRKIS